MELNRDDLIAEMYADNLILKAKVKLLLHLLMLIASKEIDELDASKIIDAYNSKIEQYVEDQRIVSHLGDEYLQSKADEFLKKIKDELK